MSNRENSSIPSFGVSLIPIGIVIISLGFSVFSYGAEPHISLFFGSIVAGLVAFFNGYSWKEIEEGFLGSIKKALPSLIILLIIGLLISVWISSGIVPALIYYGFSVMLPTWFLPSILVFCSLMSIITGSSWTTVGTIGVAAIGVGQGLGIPAPVIAGAVVSGAFFGDKLSPMSDSTNLTPSVLDVDLYSHIKHMLYTTIPSFIIALLMYTFLGLFLAEGSTDAQTIAHYQETILENFNLSFWLFIPPVAVISLILFKVPAIPSLVAGVILGGALQLMVQGQSFNDLYHVLYEGYSISTGWDEFDALLSRGGMASMFSVVALAITALSFGGIMYRCNMLHSLVSKLSILVRSRGHLVSTTLVTCIFLNIFSANQYLAVIIPGQMYGDSYKKLGLKLKNLSRALEAGGTLTSPLVPWNSSGVFVYSVLSVNPLFYAPYAFVCWLTPIVAAIFGYTDITMERTQNY